jgi:cell division protein FtsA
MEPTYIAAIEIGSSHIRASVGLVDESGILSVIGVEEECAIDAVRYGGIQNVEEIGNRVNKLITKLQEHPNIAPRRIKAVYVALGGRGTMGSTAQVTRTYDEEVEVTPTVLKQLEDEARTQGFSDNTVIDVLPRRFTIDNLECANPRGTFGKSICADFNIITCKPLPQRNLSRAISNRQAITIKEVYVRQNALANMVLTGDEKKLGCMLVDFGAETTTVSIYKNGFLQYFATLPIGSRCITRDIMSLGYTEEKAEEIKRTIGDAVNPDPNVRKSNFEGDATEVNNYIRARAGEIAVNIAEQCKYAGMSFTADLLGGIILVGGGTKLRGFAQLMEQNSNVKVRLGGLNSDIRVSDARLQGIDTLDVISILYLASKNPQECTELPEPEVPVAPADDDDDDSRSGFMPRNAGKKGKKAPKEEEEEKQPRPSKISRFMNRLGTFFQENDDDDE